MASPQNLPNLQIEQQAVSEGFRCIAGVDEAGRGPLAGPVVVAAVILGAHWDISHPLNDSKKLSEKQRELLFNIIRTQAQSYSIQVMSPAEIDKINILQATLTGMKLAVDKLRVHPDYVLVDGNQYPPLSIKGKTVVRGDAISMSIAAASVLAKVARDRIMKGWSKRYPEWDFEQHKGYPTAKHRQAIQIHGLSPIHRRSFCRSVLSQTQLSLFPTP
ncbi:MAG: ribonuclease HII [SAR324 cluster bacterium]|nr:ribonuclease HII [SAR324 cluster bacterium]MBF0350037.1 ribonuclease HII [SAR324 cluster bacterium]